MSSFNTSVIGVTGASGRLGRRVLELLVEQGARNLVGLTRTPDRLGDLAARGIELRAASFDDKEGLAAAIAGIERLLIISTDAVGIPGGRVRQHVAAIEAAERAGVRHIAYTSLTSPYPDPSAPIPNDHFWTEARLFASPAQWSVLRNNQYTDYLLPSARHAIASGIYAHAAGSGRRAYVTHEDCAAAAAGALLRAEGRRVFDIAGPDALDGDAVAALLAQISGRPVAARDIPAAALTDALRTAGLPAIMATAIARFDTDARKGYLAITGDHVAELTGRAPQSVAAFLTASKAALSD